MKEASAASIGEARAGPASGLSRPLVVAAVGAGALLAATGVLWAHYGTAVFYELIVAGLAACL